MSRTRTTLLALLPIMAMMAIVSAAQAGTTTDAARHFLQDQTRDMGSTVTVTMHEPKARLPACTNPQPFLPGHGQRLLGRVTVGVRCAEGQTRYLQARVTAIGPYWVAAQQIPAGTTITAPMLKTRTGDLSHLPHAAIHQPNQAVGKVTTTFLANGSVVLESTLKAQALVHRRQAVTVEASGRGFRITRQGLALHDGGLGDTVRVRMTDRSVLAGVVSGKNLIEVSY